jgi:hypothetical protein
MEFDDARMMPLNTFTGATWYSKRLSNYALYVIQNSSTVSYPQSSNNYTYCSIQVCGAPANTPSVALVEVVYNLEITAMQDSAAAMLGQKGPTKNDAVLTGASHVQNSIPGTIMTGVEDAGKIIGDVIAKSPLGILGTIGSDLLKAF